MAQRGTTERVLMGCGALAILSVLAAVLLSLGVFLGRSDVEVEAPVEEAVDELDEVVDEQRERGHRHRCGEGVRSARHCLLWDVRYH